MQWDGIRVLPATGDAAASPLRDSSASADFTGQCAQCGCQLDELVCVEPDCDGCTVEIENETCRHVFSHRVCNPAVNRHVHNRGRTFFRTSSRKLARGKGDQLDAGGDRADRLHHESISHTVRIGAPSSDQPVSRLHGRRDVTKHAQAQINSPSLVCSPASVAEAGERATLPGGRQAQ